MPVLNLSRFQTVTSALDSGIGVFLQPLGRVQIISIGYSFFDTSGLFVPGTGIFQSRAALIRGPIDFDPATFANSSASQTDLSRFGFNLIGDFFINDIGPGIIPFHPDADESWIEGDEGLTILLAKGVSTTANTHFIGKMVPGSRYYTRAQVLQNQRQQGAVGGSGSGGGGGTGGGSGGGNRLVQGAGGFGGGGHRGF